MKLIFSAEGFYQQSETDKVEAFSFSKKTVEIAPVVWWTGRYQTSAGTGSSIQNTEKTAATLTLRCTISLSLLGLSPYSSSPGQLVLCVSFVQCFLSILCLWASILLLSHLLLVESAFSLPDSGVWEGKGKNPATHIYKVTEKGTNAREQQVH